MWFSPRPFIIDWTVLCEFSPPSRWIPVSSILYCLQAMYLHCNDAAEPIVVPSPSPMTGLYIRTRGGDLSKVTIPANCLAFQTGEALELATAGRLRATPHCVRVGAGQGTENISRETFVLFMQPDTDQSISESQTFGQFSKQAFDEHYEKPSTQS